MLRTKKPIIKQGGLARRTGGQARRIGGFTIIEVVVTVALLATLSTVLFVAMRWPSRRGRDTQREADLNQVKLALEQHYLDQAQREFPMPNTGSEEGDYLGLIGFLSNYLGTMPQDPQYSNQVYSYRVSGDSQCFELSAIRETDPGNIVVCGGEYSCRVAFCLLPGLTPLPTLTPGPSPTLGPLPTSTPAPTLAPTSTPGPTATPTLTPTATPTSAPTPTLAPTPTPTPEPTCNDSCVSAGHLGGQCRLFLCLGGEVNIGQDVCSIFYRCCCQPVVAPTPTPTPTPTPSYLFADSFESGDFSAWSSTATDGGDLSATSGAAIVGSYGMSVNVDDTSSMYVRDDTPNNEIRYRYRLYLDPNDVEMASWSTHTIFIPYESNGEMTMYLYIGGKRSFTSGYSIGFAMRQDDYSTIGSSWYNIDDAPHLIEVDYITGSGTSGLISLWLDGDFKETVNGDNDGRPIDYVRLGAVSSVDATTLGTYYIDHFASNNTGNLIGP
ncbi:type II secretion system GspH family protein [Patescibacteria group bacterium]|nr:type II secretion system GspH family protein [Patescibacteria group bacterium]MBU1868547.1 type II secretion system GspH family protein [Patescibacteria group bacterium]